MKRYVEASPKARQWFFLGLAIWAGLILLTFRFNVYFPLYGSDQEQLAQVSARALYSFIAFVAGYMTLSILVVTLAFKAVRTKQWPPAGVRVPFRTSIQEIRNPMKVWLVAVVFIALYAVHIASGYYKWRWSKQQIDTLSSLMSSPNNSLRPTVEREH